MIRLGEIQELVIVKKVEFGVYLSETDKDADERVLLPAKQVPENSQLGDTLSVFIYRDSGDRLIATTREVRLTLGKAALLKVAQVGKIGAFLDWGLEKDLLLPFKEQTWRIEEGEECLAALYIDKSNRLCATMKVYPYLELGSPYKKDDRVVGRVYEVSAEFGAFVAVDDKYSGLIAVREMYGNIKAGDIVTARVAGVKEDGKLDLSLREKAYLQMGADADRVMEAIEGCGGELPFNDKADPDKIKREMQMSKNEFKRAVGRLLKEKKIVITESGIKKR